MKVGTPKPKGRYRGRSARSRLRCCRGKCGRQVGSTVEFLGSVSISQAYKVCCVILKSLACSFEARQMLSHFALNRFTCVRAIRVCSLRTVNVSCTSSVNWHISTIMGRITSDLWSHDAASSDAYVRNVLEYGTMRVLPGSVNPTLEAR